MAELLTLARPYAKAAFSYAAEQGVTDNWSNALQILSAAVQDEAFSAYLNRPEITPEGQLKLFTQVLGEAQSEALSKFILMLAENDRLSLLPQVLIEYEDLKLRRNKIVNITIESAFPLTAVQEQLLTKALEKRFSGGIKVAVKVNPALIAGVVIRAGDQVIDDSALSKLEKMRTRLLA